MLELGNWVAFFAFYVVSLPCAYIFTFTLKMGMVGLWWGIVAGSLAEVVLYFFFLRFIANWRRLAKKISTQMKEGDPALSWK
jgi:Na+-driven multidrug efflux pump